MTAPISMTQIMIVAAIGLCEATASQKMPTARDRWLLRAPLGLYAGWLAAASWVSVALIGAGYGLFFDAGTWAVIVIIAATLTAVGIIRSFGDLPEFGAAVVWALVAIAVKSAGSDTRVAVLAGIGAAVVAIFAGLSLSARRA